MFGRRKKPNRLQQLQDFLWPRIGWRRSASYMVHRVGRMKGTSYAIAAGFACGAAVSFLPLMGFHFILAAALAWAIGGSVLASAVGTVVGNPWTFPVIWWTAYQLGGRLIGQATPDRVARRLSIEYIFDHPGDVFWPMMAGGTLLAVVAWIASFTVVWFAVSQYRERRNRRRMLKAARRAQREAQP